MMKADKNVGGYCDSFCETGRVSFITLKCHSQTSTPLCWHKQKELLVFLKVSRGYVVMKSEEITNVNCFVTFC